MVGRGRELHSLADAFERAAAERSCHLFTVLGAAGVGKSRLVREALAGSATARAVLVGPACPTARGSLLARSRGRQAGDRDRGRRLAGAGAGEDRGDAAETTSPQLAAERVAALVGLDGDGRRPRSRASGPFRKLVEALARERPTVIVFDDVNWGEPHFLDLSSTSRSRSRDARSSSSAWPGPSCSSCGRAGVAASGTPRRSSSSRCPSSRRANCSRTCSRRR